MDDRELSRMVALESLAQRYADEASELRAEVDRLKKSALDDARAECIEGISGLEHVIREQSKEIERLKAQLSALRETAERFSRDAMRYIGKTLDDQHNPVWDSDEALTRLLNQIKGSGPQIIDLGALARAEMERKP